MIPVIQKGLPRLEQKVGEELGDLTPAEIEQFITKTPSKVLWAIAVFLVAACLTALIYIAFKMNSEQQTVAAHAQTISGLAKTKADSATVQQLQTTVTKSVATQAELDKVIAKNKSDVVIIVRKENARIAALERRLAALEQQNGTKVPVKK